MNGDLIRSKGISLNFGNETRIIKEKFVKAFIYSVLRDFNNKTIPPVADEDEYIIPPYLFETPKKKIKKISILSSK